MIETINSALFALMVKSGSALLEQNKQRVNDLNVFPVPDGDTGSNMSFTINAGTAELVKNPGSALTEGADRFASALLRGARGNSGVILSLLFRGFAKQLKGIDEATPVQFAAALKEGVSTAYNAVMRPTEGTVLTVARLAADAAVEHAESSADFISLFDRVIEAGDAALANTINQNPVLKKAGVIDAGGEGYMLVLRGMLAALKGEPIESSSPAQTAEKAEFANFTAEDITFTYCTEFIVNRENVKSPEVLRNYLQTIGDSLVFVEDDEIIKVHVHTDTPGEALTRALAYGSFVTVKIENMRLQHTEILSENSAPEEPAVAAPEKKYGFVSVCSGAGLKDAFTSLGVDKIVDGGQTMNPSTEDILKAVNSVPAEVVFVFPNNKNIIMAAEQCIPLTEKQVVVVHSKTVPQGITALFSFDETLDTETLTQLFTEGCGTVHTALVTHAVRDSEFDGASIKEGEYLGLVDGRIAANDFDLDSLMSKLIGALEEFAPDMVNIYYGEEAEEDGAQHICSLFEEKLSDTETSLINGGQPVYLYMISAE